MTAWHSKLNGRELSAQRSKEITSAAKQGREFFRNAFGADYSVRPLLAFYGVASLSRSLALLLQRQGGEETLPQSHGLSAINWSGVMAGNLSQGLARLGSLEIETTKGLFSSFIRETRNTICVHLRSSSVEWRLPYTVPAAGARVTLEDLLIRIPDLRHQHSQQSQNGLYSSIDTIEYTSESGFSARVLARDFDPFKDAYASVGYKTVRSKNRYNISAESVVFRREPPQLVHTYVKAVLGIPSPYIAKPFSGGQRYSQIATTYMLSYYLGMISRYYPTHWIALLGGEKGDALWPSMNAAQRYVEISFPILIDGFLHDALSRADVKSS